MLILALLALAHLVGFHLGSAARFPRGEVAIATTSAVIAAIAIAVAVAVTPALAFVAVGPAHHRRRPSVVLIDAHGEKANDVGREPHLTLEFVHGVMRGIDVHQRVVGFAVLLDAERERLQSPIFGLADRPATSLEEGTKILQQGLDLLGGNILPRQKYVLIDRHETPLLRLLRREASHGRLEGRPKRRPRERRHGRAAYTYRYDERSSVQPPTGAIAGGGLIRLCAAFARVSAWPIAEPRARCRELPCSRSARRHCSLLER